MRSEHKEIMKSRRRNVCLVVAYDGTNYHGFQRQTVYGPAVQNILEEKLPLIFGDNIEMAAAGRTDSGVHASGQVVNFFTDGTIPADRIVRAINALLPEDIVVRAALDVARDFSALHSSCQKEYIYCIQQGETTNPFQQRYSWHIRRKLNVEAMQEAIQLLLGEHDFSAFKAAGGNTKTNIRTMEKVECREVGDNIFFVFRADGFLYHMVRNLAGTLVDVGLGRKSVADFQHILLSCDRSLASATAPARGLTLGWVSYEAKYHIPVLPVILPRGNWMAE